jgi:hypothetical protein
VEKIPLCSANFFSRPTRIAELSKNDEAQRPFVYRISPTIAILQANS